MQTQNISKIDEANAKAFLNSIQVQNWVKVGATEYSIELVSNNTYQLWEYMPDRGAYMKVGGEWRCKAKTRRGLVGAFKRRLNRN